MNLRNFIIEDCEVDNKNLVIDGIKELELVINDNYDLIKKREIAIEFNIGSRLGEQNEYIIVYSNPEYKNNPYVFVLKRDDIPNPFDKLSLEELLFLRENNYFLSK